MPDHIEPESGAPYIIICDTRIAVFVATDQHGKICAVSHGASALVSFMQSYYKQFQLADGLPISTLQHELMDHLLGDAVLTPEQVTAKIDALINEMGVLEDKYQS